MDWKLLPMRIQEVLRVPSVICGGAVRDTILGGNIRDIDLYVSHEDFQKVRCLITGVTIDPWDDLCAPRRLSNSVVHQQGDEEYDHQYIWVQEEVDSPDYNYPVNIIGVHEQAYRDLGGLTGHAITSLFNLSTSQCWLRPDGIPTYSYTFEISRANQCINILREEWGKEGTKRCVLKFLDKYPGWRVSVPDVDVVPASQAEAALDAWITGSML